MSQQDRPQIDQNYQSFGANNFEDTLQKQTPTNSIKNQDHDFLRAKLENDLKNSRRGSALGYESQSQASSKQIKSKPTSGANSRRQTTGTYGNSPDKKLEMERQKIRNSVAQSTTGKMKEFRKSMAIDQNISNKLRQSVTNTMERASASFKTQGGENAGDLKIENERLKSTLLILNQKLKTNADTGGHVNRLKDQNTANDAEIKVLKEDNNSLKIENAQLKSENSIQKSQIEQMKASAEVQDQIMKDLRLEHKASAEVQDRKFQALKLELDESEEARVFLKEDIEQLNDKIITFEEELFESKTIQLDLLDQLKQVEYNLQMAEDKIEELIRINEEMEKTQAVYIAHKYDRIDKTLGHYLNRYPEKKQMNIMFLRESEGVYQFGQKRVYVKVEKGDQILCRVGGGFMHIDEFIHKYTQTEVEKIERRDVLERFQNKAAVQKIAVDHARRGYESSPIRSPRKANTSPAKRSPMKGHRKSASKATKYV